MKKLFLLVKDDIGFSKEEVLSLYKPENHELVEGLLFFDTIKDYSDRLALTKSIYNLIEIARDVKVCIETIDWNNLVKGSFKVRCDDNNLEKELAGKIYNKLKDPKVDLKNPDSYIQIFVRDKTYFICILDKMVSTDWKDRKPHMKPELSPTSLNPRIARAMINLCGKEEGRLCDPFCGTGGILVEGGLLKYELLGFDIDAVSLKKAKINLEHYHIDDYELLNEDALKNNNAFDFVVTDLPYGLNTKINTELEKLYKEFFKKYYELCDVIIGGLPDFIDHKNLLGNWKIKNEFTIYLHKSLSKKILKLIK